MFSLAILVGLGVGDDEIMAGVVQALISHASREKAHVALTSCVAHSRAHEAAQWLCESYRQGGPEEHLSEKCRD